MSEAYVSAQQPQTSQEPRLSAPDVDPGRAGHLEVATPQGAAPPVGLIWRVRDRRTFAAFRRGRRSRRGPITVTWVDGPPTEPPKVAFAIGRKVGGAVERNRLRRRLRAIASELAPHLRPGAYLIGAAPEAATLAFGDLRTHVSDAAAAVTRDPAS
jgi:ribonuclease P protein component